MGIAVAIGWCSKNRSTSLDFFADEKTQKYVDQVDDEYGYPAW